MISARVVRTIRHGLLRLVLIHLVGGCHEIIEASTGKCLQSLRLNGQRRSKAFRYLSLRDQSSEARYRRRTSRNPEVGVLAVQIEIVRNNPSTIGLGEFNRVSRSNYTLVEDRAELRLHQAFLEDRILHPVCQNSALGFREGAKRRPHLELEDLEWVQHKLTNRIASLLRTSLGGDRSGVAGGMMANRSLRGLRDEGQRDRSEIVPRNPFNDGHADGITESEHGLVVRD